MEPSQENARRKKVAVIAVTCSDGEPLETCSSVTLNILDADEKSTVMTRSFTSMLRGLQYMATTASGNDSFRQALFALAEQVQPLLQDLLQKTSRGRSPTVTRDCVPVPL